MELLLIRHGETDWNSQGKMMGKCDKPLNEKGLAQAEKTKTLLQDTGIDLIICSPLIRAKQNAEIVNRDRNIPVHYDARITERNFGEFEGKTSKEFSVDDYWDYYKNIHYQSAENIQDFFRRIYAFLDDIIAKYQDKTVLIVAHGGASRAIGYYFAGEIPKGSLARIGYHLQNCQVAEYEI